MQTFAQLRYRLELAAKAKKVKDEAKAEAKKTEMELKSKIKDKEKKEAKKLEATEKVEAEIIKNAGLAVKKKLAEDTIGELDRLTTVMGKIQGSSKSGSHFNHVNHVNNSIAELSQLTDVMNKLGNGAGAGHEHAAISYTPNLLPAGGGAGPLNTVLGTPNGHSTQTPQAKLIDLGSGKIGVLFVYNT